MKAIVPTTVGYGQRYSGTDSSHSSIPHSVPHHQPGRIRGLRRHGLRSLNVHTSQKHVHYRSSTAKKVRPSRLSSTHILVQGTHALDRHKHWQAKYIKSNREADTESHVAAQQSADGHPAVLPVNMGDIWLLYDAHTPSFPPKGSVHWVTPLWSTEVTPSAKDTVFHTHEDHHKGMLYPLYVRGWSARGLWRMEKYHPYCCTELEVGARHECHCQLRHGTQAFKDVTEQSKHWQILYTNYNISITTKNHPRPQHSNWVTIGVPQQAAYYWSLTPWNPNTPLPSEQLRDIWVKVVMEY